MTRFALLSAIVALHLVAVLSINFMGENGNGIPAAKTDSSGFHDLKNGTWWRQDDSLGTTSIDKDANYSKIDLESREIENIRDVLLKVAEKDYVEDVAYTKSLDNPSGGSKVINRYERVSHELHSLDLSNNLDDKNETLHNSSNNQEILLNKSSEIIRDDSLDLEFENISSTKEFELQLDFGPIINIINESRYSIEFTKSLQSTESELLTEFSESTKSIESIRSAQPTETTEFSESTEFNTETSSINVVEIFNLTTVEIDLQNNSLNKDFDGLNSKIDLDENNSRNSSNFGPKLKDNLTISEFSDKNNSDLTNNYKNNTFRKYFVAENFNLSLDINGTKFNKNQSSNTSQFKSVKINTNLRKSEDLKEILDLNIRNVADVKDKSIVISRNFSTDKFENSTENQGNVLLNIANNSVSGNDTENEVEGITRVDDENERIEMNEELGSSITVKKYAESRRIKINDSNSESKNRSETNLLRVVGNLRATNVDDLRRKKWTKENYVASKETTIERPEIVRQEGSWKIFNNLRDGINNFNGDDSIDDDRKLNERSHEMYFRDEILNDVDGFGVLNNNKGGGQLIKVFVPDYSRGNDDDGDKKVVEVAKGSQPFGGDATTKRAMIKRSRPSMDQSSSVNENSGKEETAATEAAPQTTDEAAKGSKETSSTSLEVKSSTVLFVGFQDDARTTTAIQPTRDQLPTNSNYYLATRKDASESTTSSDKLVATECPNCTWIAAASNTTTDAVSSTSMNSESISDEQTESIENTTSYANTSIGDDERTNSSLKVPEFPWPVKREAVVEGDIVLGGLMMVHEREDSVTCGPIMPQGGIQALEAMLYTLDMLNEGPDQLLPNVTLGAHILDDCDKDTYGLEMAVDFIKG